MAERGYWGFLSPINGQVVMKTPRPPIKVRRTRRARPPSGRLPVPSRLRRARRRPPAPMSVRPVQPSPARSTPQPGARRQPSERPRAGAGRLLWWGLIMPLTGLLALVLMFGLILALSFGLIYHDRILPHVSAAGLPLGGMSQEEAAQALRQQWTTITLRDGSRTWQVDAARFGITLDADAMAARAYQQGRSQGPPLQGLLREVDVPAILAVDGGRARQALLELSPQLEIAPVNAGIRLVNGHVEATPPVDGRALDLEPTLASWQDRAALADGALDLVMRRLPPAVTDASPLIAAAERLLASPLDFRVYDPVTGDTVHWSVPMEQWGQWLSVTSPADDPLALTFAVDEDQVRGYLAAQADAVFDPGRYINVDEAVAAVRASLDAGQAAGYVRVYHRDRQHIVQPGETLITIAWDYGVPYPWIQQANPGAETLSPGQTITIPSPDNFLEFPVVPDKRIVVSIGEQRAWVYEDGQLKWEWPVSTGISSSPTWPGIYQIISHEPNAYAANWDLYMPYFLGVYRPIPGSDFTNGFHGFPTRGGSQLLWTNSLGRRVTYGCILLSNQNAEAL